MSCTAPSRLAGSFVAQDGGEHWEQLSHGQYVNDDPVDMHGVLASTFRPGSVLGIGRAGMFRSTDKGDHWARVQLDPLNEKGADLLPPDPRGAR